MSRSILAFDYVIDRDRRLIVTTAEGIVTTAEVRAKLDRLFSDPAFDPHLDELIDATGVREMQVPSADVLEFLNVCLLERTSRTAWVVRKSGKWSMLAHMFAAWMSTHGECRVFHDTPSALEWIAEPN